MAIDPANILLTDRVAVVTGGGAGIGRGIAAGLKAFGAKVSIWERDPASCAAAADEIGALGIPTDVRDSAAVDAALAQTVAELGPVTILVNNAGGVFWSGILDTSENGWDALYKSNLRHVYLCTQRVARGLVEQKLTGSVISVTSIEGVRAAPGYATYAAAKAGVINYTKTAALELAPYGIRVNALAPDITLTEGIRKSHPRVPRSGSASRCRWDAQVTSTRWPAQQSFSRPTCRAISPGRRSTSTAAPRRPAAGTTIRRPAPMRSDQADATHRTDPDGSAEHTFAPHRARPALQRAFTPRRCRCRYSLTAVPNSRRWTWPGHTWAPTLCSAAGYWSCCASAAPSWASASPAVNHASTIRSPTKTSRACSRQSTTLTPQEQLAVEFLDLLSGDHHLIDDEFYRRLGEHFTAAQIIELGFTCATTMGLHRFLHTLDVYGDSIPVIDYSPDQVDSAAHQ